MGKKDTTDNWKNIRQKWQKLLGIIEEKFCHWYYKNQTAYSVRILYAWRYQPKPQEDTKRKRKTRIKNQDTVKQGYQVHSTMVNPWTSQQIETSGGGSLVTSLGGRTVVFNRPITRLGGSWAAARRYKNTLSPDSAPGENGFSLSKQSWYFKYTLLATVAKYYKRGNPPQGP